MKYFSTDQIAFVHREGHGLLLNPARSIEISTEILGETTNPNQAGVYLYPPSPGESFADISADKLRFSSHQSRLREGLEYSVVYGERLVEILEWIIGVLKTHSHGPNSPAVPDFHVQANSYLESMTTYLLNRNVRTR